MTDLQRRRRAHHAAWLGVWNGESPGQTWTSGAGPARAGSLIT
jgi:hypothetical protein